MRVLHVIPAVAARYGGPSQAIFEICTQLQFLGIETVIATTNADGHTVLPVSVGTIQNYQQVPTIFYQRDFSEAFKYSHGLADWLRQTVDQFDLVHIHAVFSHACLAAARACRQSGVPYIVRTIGNLDPWSLRQKSWRKKLFWRFGVKRMLRGAVAIHYTALAERQLAETALGLKRGVVIPLGVDYQLLEKTTKENSFVTKYSELQQQPYILTLCRLHPKKNLELLLKVFLRMVESPELRHWKLVIAGDGEAGYASKLRALAHSAGCTERVVFTGWLQGDLKYDALRAAKLFALPSHQENFGLSVVEAMACGVPVVISEHVNLAADIAEANAGWVVNLTEKSLETALFEALQHQQVCAARGMAAHDLVRARFTWPVVAQELANLYDGICNKSLSAV